MAVEYVKIDTAGSTVCSDNIAVINASSLPPEGKKEAIAYINLLCPRYNYTGIYNLMISLGLEPVVTRVQLAPPFSKVDFFKPNSGGDFYVPGRDQAIHVPSLGT